MARREPSIPILRLEGMMPEDNFQENINKGEKSAALLTEGVSLCCINVPRIDPIVAPVALVENERDFRPKVSSVDLVNFGLLMRGKIIAHEQGNQGQSSAELFPTIHCGENLDAIQHKTHVQPFIFSTCVGENLDESFSHSNLMAVDHKHFRWKRLARQGTVNPSGIVLDESSLGKRV
ncbi:hypothetical protein ACOSQ2_032156 [Xanthoceras sorbifolium]